MDQELQKIVDAITRTISKTMRDSKEACKTMFAQHADNDVLDHYYPTQYVRRSENGPYGGTTGIADEKSYEVHVKGLEMTIENKTKGNPRYKTGTDGWDSGNITEIIENGVGYNWRNSEIYRISPFPRPYMEEAGNDFVDNLLIPMVDIAMKNLLGG